MSQAPRMTPAPRPTRRQELLRSAGLLWATPQQQREFWTRRCATFRPRAVNAGSLARAFLSAPRLRVARRLQAVLHAWEAIVPPEYAAHARPESLRGGRLRVVVDEPAIRFALERQCGPELLEFFADQPGLGAIHAIDFRLAALGAGTGEA